MIKRNKNGTKKNPGEQRKRKEVSTIEDKDFVVDVKETIGEGENETLEFDP